MLLDTPCDPQAFGIWYLVFGILWAIRAQDAVGFGRIMRCLPLPLALALSFAAQGVSVRHACIRYYVIVEGIGRSWATMVR